MSFPLVGNLKIASAVTGFIKENRLPHAIIIEGDKGTGRHTLAKYISAAAVCSGENPPCNTCRDCLNSANLSHPDIIVVAPEENKKNISVNQIRTLRDEAYVKPHGAARRVFIIDCADTMNDQSQNALLKVLEEPPATVIFILVAESKASLLSTVISRCVILSLTVPDRSVAAQYVKGVGTFNENEIATALESANNNIGQAISFLLGKDSTATEAAAKEFIEYFLRDDMWGMLTSLAPFEKNRVLADRLFKDLKLHTAALLKKDSISPAAKRFSKLYSLLCELEKPLVTNINLGLLFSRLTAAAAEIGKII